MLEDLCAGPMPNFGPTEEEKAYQGDPSSREDMAAHTARMAALAKEQVHFLIHNEL